MYLHSICKKKKKRQKWGHHHYLLNVCVSKQSIKIIEAKNKNKKSAYLQIEVWDCSDKGRHIKSKLCKFMRSFCNLFCYCQIYVTWINLETGRRKARVEGRSVFHCMTFHTFLNCIPHANISYSKIIKMLAVINSILV